MNKYDGSNVYFSTSGLNLNNVKDFFKGKVSDYIFERIISYFNANKHQVVFIRVCPSLPKNTDLIGSPVEFVHYEEFYSQRLEKVEIPTMNVADKISSLEKRIKELEEQLESTKPVKPETIKQWVPKKEKHCVNLHLNKVFSINRSNVFVDIIPELTYPTLDLAHNARKSLVLHATLLKYHSEFCPDYKPDWKNEVKKYTVAFDNDENEYKVDWKYRVNSLTDVYFPEDIARFLVDKLNSGEVVL